MALNDVASVEVEANARRGGRTVECDTNDDPNIRDGGTLLVIYVCHLNILAHSFIKLSFKVPI